MKKKEFNGLLASEKAKACKLAEAIFTDTDFIVESDDGGKTSRIDDDVIIVKARVSNADITAEMTVYVDMANRRNSWVTYQADDHTIHRSYEMPAVRAWASEQARLDAEAQKLTDDAIRMAKNSLHVLYDGVNFCVAHDDFWDTYTAVTHSFLDKMSPKRHDRLCEAVWALRDGYTMLYSWEWDDMRLMLAEIKLKADILDSIDTYIFGGHTYADKADFEAQKAIYTQMLMDGGYDVSDDQKNLLSDTLDAWMLYDEDIRLVSRQDLYDKAHSTDMPLSPVAEAIYAKACDIYTDIADIHRQSPEMIVDDCDSYTERMLSNCLYDGLISASEEADLRVRLRLFAREEYGTAIIDGEAIMIA